MSSIHHHANKWRLRRFISHCCHQHFRCCDCSEVRGGVIELLLVLNLS